MRPRDPRRVLLESSAEAVQANHRSAQANEATDSGPTPQYRQRSSPPPNAPPTLRQLSTNSLGNTHDQREGRPTPDEMNQTINTSLSSKQLSTGQEIAALKEETLFDERNKERGREPTQNPVSEARDVSSEEATREETSDNLDPWDALLRKPRFGPSHWGGSDMHRDFEQLLEDLDEVQRVSIQNERKRRMQEQDRMFSAGKLCLVLDLDHTLLNSAKVNIIACGATPNSSSDPEYRLTLKLFLMKICTWLYFIVDWLAHTFKLCISEVHQRE